MDCVSSKPQPTSNYKIVKLIYKLSSSSSTFLSCATLAHDACQFSLKWQQPKPVFLQVTLFQEAQCNNTRLSELYRFVLAKPPSSTRSAGGGCSAPEHKSCIILTSPGSSLSKISGYIFLLIQISFFWEVIIQLRLAAPKVPYSGGNLSWE